MKIKKEHKNKLELNDSFCFSCSKKLGCYTTCCSDVTIVLTPYDVLRLRRAIGITSSDFLDKYTNIISVKDKIIPIVYMKMNGEKNKECFFVNKDGCMYYNDRPWACRMFPLSESQNGGFHIVSDIDSCYGLSEEKEWKVQDWLLHENATQSKEIDGGFESLISNDILIKLENIDNVKVQQMVLLSLYDLDKFRKFVLFSSFLDKFDIDRNTINTIKIDDFALLDLGYAWVRFGLLGQKTLSVKNVTSDANCLKN